MPTRSVSANPDEELVKRFDEAWEAVWDEYGERDSYSRSQAIERSMEIAVNVLGAWERAQGEPPHHFRELLVLTDDAVSRRVDYEDLMAGQ